MRRNAGMPRHATRESRRSRRAEPSRVPTGIAHGHGVALTAIAVVGAAMSLYLTYVRGLLLAGADGGGLCAVGPWVNCGAVLGSPYASAAGVPLSALGLWFYAVMGTVALSGLRRSRGRFPRSPAVVLFVAYALATGISLIVAVVSVAFIGSFCLLCASRYVLNLTGLILAWRAVRATSETLSQALATERSYWKIHRQLAIGYAAAALVPLALVIVVSRASWAKVDVCEAAAAASRDQRPLRLSVFSDFQCSHCQELHRALQPVRDNPLVQVVLRHYPLEAECNPRVRLRLGGHRGACLQARAAICAEGQGRLREYGDRLFDAGPADGPGLVALARSMGMDGTRFASCLGSTETTQVLDRDVNAAIAENVRGTPTVFIDGRRLTGVPSTEDIGCLVAAGRSR